jgi:hypothetical protein
MEPGKGNPPFASRLPPTAYRLQPSGFRLPASGFRPGSPTTYPLPPAGSGLLLRPDDSRLPPFATRPLRLSPRLDGHDGRLARAQSHPIPDFLAEEVAGKLRLVGVDVLFGF